MGGGGTQESGIRADARRARDRTPYLPFGQRLTANGFERLSSRSRCFKGGQPGYLPRPTRLPLWHRARKSGNSPAHSSVESAPKPLFDAPPRGRQGSLTDGPIMPTSDPHSILISTSSSPRSSTRQGVDPLIHLIHHRLHPAVISRDLVADLPD